MKNLNWIRNLYQLDSYTTPTKKAKIAGALVSIAIALLLYKFKGLHYPLLISSIIVFLTFSRLLSKPFFRALNLILFFIFHTINLMVLTGIFYFLITPLAFIFRLKDKQDLFFKKINKKTIEDTTHTVIEFERQF